MDVFGYNLLPSLHDSEHDPWLSSDSLPMPNFLINDPHADTYTPCILEDGVIDSDQATDQVYNSDPAPDSSSFTRPKSSWSAPEVSVTLEKLIEQQSQLISKAFESWRSKFPIKSDTSSAPNLSRLPNSKSSPNKSSPVLGPRLDNESARETRGSLGFDPWTIACEPSPTDSEPSSQ